MKKLIRNHIWVTLPDQLNISYLGITDFSKEYLLRFQKFDHTYHFKTRYGINFKNRIGSFLDEIREEQQSKSR